jgi:hypothetical protein
MNYDLEEDFFIILGNGRSFLHFLIVSTFFSSFYMRLTILLSEKNKKMDYIWCARYLYKDNLKRDLDEILLSIKSFRKLKKTFTLMFLFSKCFMYISSLFFVIFMTTCIYKLSELNLTKRNFYISLIFSVILIIQLYYVFSVFAFFPSCLFGVNNYYNHKFKFICEKFKIKLINGKMILKLLRLHLKSSNDINNFNDALKYINLTLYLSIPIIDVFLYGGYISEKLEYYFINFSRVLAVETMFIWIFVNIGLVILNKQVCKNRYLFKLFLNFIFYKANKESIDSLYSVLSRNNYNWRIRFKVKFLN